MGTNVMLASKTGNCSQHKIVLAVYYFRNESYRCDVPPLIREDELGRFRTGYSVWSVWCKTIPYFDSNLWHMFWDSDVLWNQIYLHVNYKHTLQKEYPWQSCFCHGSIICFIQWRVFFGGEPFGHPQLKDGSRSTGDREVTFDRHR